MTSEEKLISNKVRLKKLENNSRNIKSPGVLKKIKRTIRNLEKENQL
jgi:hypothetical protein